MKRPVIKELAVFQNRLVRKASFSSGVAPAQAGFFFSHHLHIELDPIEITIFVEFKNAPLRATRDGERDLAWLKTRLTQIKPITFRSAPDQFMPQIIRFKWSNPPQHPI